MATEQSVTDFYDLLGVEHGASEEDIEEASRDAVREHHPDQSDKQNAIAKFQTVKTARDILLDETERQKYESLGHTRYVEQELETKTLDGFQFEGNTGIQNDNDNDATNEIQDMMSTSYEMTDGFTGQEYETDTGDGGREAVDAKNTRGGHISGSNKSQSTNTQTIQDRQSVSWTKGFKMMIRGSIDYMLSGMFLRMLVILSVMGLIVGGIAVLILAFF